VVAVGAIVGVVGVVIVVVVVEVVSVVLLVLVDSPLSPPPQPTANTIAAAPPNMAAAVRSCLFTVPPFPSDRGGTTHPDRHETAGCGSSLRT
jgi:hypothetical protein